MRNPRPVFAGALALLAAAACALAACTSNPVAIAETPEQRAYALIGAYNVLLEEAVRFVEDDSGSLEARQELQELEARTTLVVETLEQAWAEYIAARAEWRSAPDTPTDRLDTASANLERWLGQAESLIGAFGAALD